MQQQSLLFKDIRGGFELFFLIHNFMLTNIIFYVKNFSEDSRGLFPYRVKIS